MGFYLVKWLSKPYTLQEEMEGVSDKQTNPSGIMVVNALYFSWVECAPLWYTPSGSTTIMAAKFVLRAGIQLQSVSATNVLPNACARIKATQKKAVRVSPGIMEEASQHDRLEYKEESEEEVKEESDKNSNESKESKLESE